MHRTSLPDDVATAFATIARHFIEIAREVANDTATRDDTTAFYDAKTAPTGPTTFRRVAAAGAFPSFKVGRKLVARKADVDAWIATQARAPRKAHSTAENDDMKFMRALRLVEVK